MYLLSLFCHAIMLNLFLNFVKCFIAFRFYKYNNTQEVFLSSVCFYLHFSLFSNHIGQLNFFETHFSNTKVECVFYFQYLLIFSNIFIFISANQFEQFSLNFICDIFQVY